MSEENEKPRRRRRPARTEEAGDAEAPDATGAGASSPPQEETFVLRRTSGVGPALLLVAGIVVSLFCGLASIAALTTVGLFFTGFGLMMTGIGCALLFGRQAISDVSVGPPGVTLHCSDRSSVTLPHAAVSDVRVRTVTSSTTSTSTDGSTSTSRSVHYAIELRKRDGGAIELGQRRHEGEAQQIASGLTWAIERAATATTPAAPTDPVALLANSPFVRATRKGNEGAADYRKAAKQGPLEVEWSLRPAASTVLVTTFMPAGFACAAYGFHLQGTSSAPAIIAAILAALFPVLLVRHALDARLTQVLRVDDESLTIEKRRGERRKEQRKIPLTSVTAVDFSHSQEIVGGVLVVRLDDQKAPSDFVASAGPGLFAALRGIVAYSRSAVQVPLGRLPFGDKVRVDLAIGAEIASRTARDEGQI